MHQMLSAACSLGCSTPSEKPSKQTRRLCLPLPQKKYRVSQLILHSFVCTHCFTLTTPDSVFTRHLFRKSLWETQLYIFEKDLKYSYENSCLFYFPRSIIFNDLILIFNMAKSFYMNHSVTGKGQRRLRLKCSPSRCMLPSQILFPFFPIPFSFDIAGRLFS